MKRIFTSLTCLSIAANAQIFSENFNSNTLPSGWSVENPDTTFNWGVGSQSGFASFPSGAAFFDDDDAGPSGINTNAKITSPVIDLSSVSSPKLSYKYANKIYDLNSQIKVEVYNGTSWVQVSSHSGESGTWTIDFNTFSYIITAYAQADNIDLTPYKNANFKLRFIYDDAGDYSYGCAIDDIIISSETLAVSDVSKNNISVYPNPATDYFSIVNNELYSDVRVVDTSGKTVKTFAEKAEKYSISDLPKGIYFIILRNKDNSITKKIIKN